MSGKGSILLGGHAIGPSSVTASVGISSNPLGHSSISLGTEGETWLIYDDVGYILCTLPAEVGVSLSFPSFPFRSTVVVHLEAWFVLQDTAVAVVTC